MKRRTSRRHRSSSRRRTSLRRNPPIVFSPETVALAHKVYGVKKNGRRRSSRRLVSLFANKQGRYASKWGSIFGKKKRKTSRKHTSVRRRPSRASVRRTSRRLGGMFGMPARFKSTLRKPRRKSRRKTSRRRRSSAPRGCWRLIVRGKTVPKRFRSSSSLRTYANRKYGRGYKYAWQAR
jgi:hypothetical protein